jgi:uncharacterized protein
MSRGPFDPRFDDLPATLPIFPLAGVLLLPGGKLPLNIFEPRYLDMTSDALAGERMIGMIQPTAHESDAAAPPVYPTGCAGRITSFAETDDGRYLITLTGLCRFDVMEELPLHRGYRRVVPRFEPYRADLEAESKAVIDRTRLCNALKAYFALQSLAVDWEAIEETADEKLVTSLAMICPFEPSEKQALLESPDLAERCRKMTALMEMAVLNSAASDALRH